MSVLMGLTSTQLPDRLSSTTASICRCLNGSDFDPTSRPLSSTLFTGVSFRAENGGLSFFSSSLPESVAILACNPHEYKCGAAWPSAGCVIADQRFSGMVHALAQRSAFADTKPYAPMQQRSDYRGYLPGIGYLPYQASAREGDLLGAGAIAP